jgi:hypothetical protein
MFGTTAQAKRDVGVHPVHALGAKRFLGQGVEAREENVIRRRAESKLRQDVSLTTSGDRDPRGAGHREVARDLERADRTARNEHTLAAEAVGVGILIRVRNAAGAGEGGQTRHVRNRPLVKSASGHDHVCVGAFARRCANHPTPARSRCTTGVFNCTHGVSENRSAYSCR